MFEYNPDEFTLTTLIAATPQIKLDSCQTIILVATTLFFNWLFVNRNLNNVDMHKQLIDRQGHMEIFIATLIETNQQLAKAVGTQNDFIGEFLERQKNVLDAVEKQDKRKPPISSKPNRLM